jgi:D-glycero-D-manno-heptose 1,7-bisphosphate phosphatase
MKPLMDNGLAPAVFLDRDGVLNEMVYDSTHGLLDSPRRPEQVVLMKNARELIQGLRELGYKVVVVTNQPGIAKGTLTPEELHAVHERLGQALHPAAWDALEYCPHHPDYGVACACRKPGPGMLYKAASAEGIDLAKSWMVGDGLVDVQAGRAAGCRTVLVTKLKVNVVERFFEMEGAQPDFVARHLLEVLECVRGRVAFQKTRE